MANWASEKSVPRETHLLSIAADIVSGGPGLGEMNVCFTPSGQQTGIRWFRYGFHVKRMLVP